MDRLKKARQTLDLTQKEFSEKLGINNNSTVSRWEQGTYNPSTKVLRKLCDYLLSVIIERF